jgi:hypothetical protein
VFCRRLSLAHELEDAPSPTQGNELSQAYENLDSHNLYSFITVAVVGKVCCLFSKNSMLIILIWWPLSSSNNIHSCCSHQGTAKRDCRAQKCTRCLIELSLLLADVVGGRDRSYQIVSISSCLLRFVCLHRRVGSRLDGLHRIDSSLLRVVFPESVITSCTSSLLLCSTC